MIPFLGPMGIFPSAKKPKISKTETAIVTILMKKLEVMLQRASLKKFNESKKAEVDRTQIPKNPEKGQQSTKTEISENPKKAHKEEGNKDSTKKTNPTKPKSTESKSPKIQKNAKEWWNCKTDK